MGRDTSWSKRGSACSFDMSMSSSDSPTSFLLAGSALAELALVFDAPESDSARFLVRVDRILSSLVRVIGCGEALSGCC